MPVGRVWWSNNKKYSKDKPDHCFLVPLVAGCLLSQQSVWYSQYEPGHDLVKLHWSNPTRCDFLAFTVVRKPRSISVGWKSTQTLAWWKIHTDPRVNQGWLDFQLIMLWEAEEACLNPGTWKYWQATGCSPWGEVATIPLRSWESLGLNDTYHVFGAGLGK